MMGRVLAARKSGKCSFSSYSFWSTGCCCSVPKSCLTLRIHGLQHARLPCPSLSPGVCSNSCLLSRWCHPTLSSSVTPFSSCPQSFQASGSFPISWLFTSGGQSIGASTSASVPPMNIQGWLLLGCCPRDTRESSPAQFESINSLVLDLNGPTVTSVHDYWKRYSSITDLCLKSFDQVFKQANLPQTLYFFDGLICEYETMKIWRLWRIFSVGS